MPAVLLDTSVYITSLRQENGNLLGIRFAPGGLHRLQHDFERARRILVPNLTDWVQTGLILSRLGRRYGHEQVGRSRLTNDTLLAMSAARMCITILTANERNFSRIAEFRRFEWRVWRPVAEA